MNGSPAPERESTVCRKYLPLFFKRSPAEKNMLHWYNVWEALPNVSRDNTVFSFKSNHPPVSREAITFKAELVPTREYPFSHLKLNTIRRFRGSNKNSTQSYHSYWLQLTKIIRVAPCENVSSVICGPRRPRSACTSAQSDKGLRCPLTESLDTS